MDQLYHLKVFVAATKHGSFSKAAESLGVTTAAVSKAISRLESSVKTRLFYRTTRSIVLTEEARLYYVTCCKIVEELEQAHRQIIHAAEDNTGALCLVVHPMLINAALSKFVSGYRALAPKINLTVIAQERAINLYDGHIDMAILPAHLIEQSTAIRRPLTASSSVLVASPEYLYNVGVPAHVAELSGHILLKNWRSRQHDTKFFELLEDGQNISVAPMSSIDGDEVLLHTIVLGGAGIAVLPETMVREDIESGRLVQVLPHCSTVDGEVEICLFYSHRNLPVRLRTFVDYCIKFFRSADIDREMYTTLKEKSRVEAPAGCWLQHEQHSQSIVVE
jgi:DNA-binding transcriptional LysR family regulator